MFRAKPYLPRWVGDHPATWREASELDVPPPPAMLSTACGQFCNPKLLSPACTVPYYLTRSKWIGPLMRISPKPMVDGFVKIFGEFRNGCDEKSVTFPRHSPHRNPDEIPESFAFAFAPFLQNKKKLCE